MQWVCNLRLLQIFVDMLMLRRLWNWTLHLPFSDTKSWLFCILYEVTSCACVLVWKYWVRFLIKDLVGFSPALETCYWRLYSSWASCVMEVCIWKFDHMLSSELFALSPAIALTAFLRSVVNMLESSISLCICMIGIYDWQCEPTRGFLDSQVCIEGYILTISAVKWTIRLSIPHFK